MRREGRTPARPIKRKLVHRWGPNTHGHSGRTRGNRAWLSRLAGDRGVIGVRGPLGAGRGLGSLSARARAMRSGPLLAPYTPSIREVGLLGNRGSQPVRWATMGAGARLTHNPLRYRAVLLTVFSQPTGENPAGRGPRRFSIVSKPGPQSTWSSERPPTTLMRSSPKPP